MREGGRRGRGRAAKDGGEVHGRRERGGAGEQKGEQVFQQASTSNERERIS